MNIVRLIYCFLSIIIFSCSCAYASELTPDFSARPQSSYKDYTHGSYSDEKAYQSPAVSRGPSRPTFSGLVLVPRTRRRSVYQPYTGSQHSSSSSRY